MLLFKLMYKHVLELNENLHRDSRTSHLPLVANPVGIITVMSLYLLFALKLGPKWMANRKPYDCKVVMQVYNLVQIAINAYAFIESMRCSYLSADFSYSCTGYNPLDYRETFMNLRYPAYVYYISKYMDLLDTVFFVLRKKNNQITFLHVYHHTAMIYAVWVYMTLVFGSHYTATGVLNSLVHVCMYSYYFVAALKLKFDLSPWKKRLTVMQITQFLYLTIHFAMPLLNNWCDLDMFWVLVVFLQNVFMLLLFCDFYYSAYVKPNRKYAEVTSASQQKNVLKTELCKSL